MRGQNFAQAVGQGDRDKNLKFEFNICFFKYESKYAFSNAIYIL